MASSPLRGMVYAVRLWSPILGRRRLDQAQDHVRIAFARPPHRAEPIRERVLKPDQALARSLGAASTSTLPTGSVAQIASKAAVVMEMRIIKFARRPFRAERPARAINTMGARGPKGRRIQHTNSLDERCQWHQLIE
jgi:hypothetical protein